MLSLIHISHLRLELFGEVEEGGRRAGVQSGRAGQRDIHPFGEIVGGAGRRVGADGSAVTRLRQTLDDVRGLAGPRQALHRLRVVEYVG